MKNDQGQLMLVPGGSQVNTPVRQVVQVCSVCLCSSRRKLHSCIVPLVNGQFANKPTCKQSSRGLVILKTSEHAESFDLKFEVNNCYKCVLQ